MCRHLKHAQTIVYSERVHVLLPFGVHDNVFSFVVQQCSAFCFRHYPLVQFNCQQVQQDLRTSE